MNNINILYEGVGGFENSFYSVSTYSMPRQELKFLHYHDVLELGICLEGSGICYTDRGETIYQKGDVQLILPFQPHYNITEDEGTLWMFLSIDVLKMSSPHINTDAAYFTQLLRKIDTSGVFNKKESPEVHRRIRDAVELFLNDTGNSIAFSDILTVKLAELILFLSGNKKQRESGYVDFKKNRSILSALSYVSDSLNRGEKPEISAMADSCFMSESYFRKIFRAAIGESPKDYTVRMQTRNAAAMLASTKLTLPEIYTRCGFEDGSTFYRCFQRIYGISPGEYRKKCRQD